MYNPVWYFCTYPYGLSFNGWHVLLCIANNRHSVTITTHAIKRYFLIWMTTVRQLTKRRRSCISTFKYTIICVYWWTRQRIHNTLIVVDWYRRLMGDKTIPYSAEPRLESFYPPFVTDIDLPYQGVVDSCNNPRYVARGGLVFLGPIPDYDVGYYNLVIVGPTSALSSRRWANVSPTYIAVCSVWTKFAPKQVMCL